VFSRGRGVKTMIDPAEDFAQAIEDMTGYRPKETILPGRMYRFSTSSKRSDTAGWCKLFLDDRTGVYGDHRTGLSSVWVAKSTKPPTLAERQQRADELSLARAKAAARQSEEWALAAARNAETWALACPVRAGDPVAKYLENRGLRLNCWPEALRYHSHLPYFDGDRSLGRYPAMLGAVTDATGQLVSVHRTYLTRDGHKADLPVVKKLAGCSARLAGCSVKLYPPAFVHGVPSIGVAEGIETALACFMASEVPTMSAISAHGLSYYQWPQEVKNLMIYADNDVSQVGQRAAETLAQRARKAGLAEQVLTPPSSDIDWADVWSALVKAI